MQASRPGRRAGLHLLCHLSETLLWNFNAVTPKSHFDYVETAHYLWLEALP